jgi:hypothetical protein
MQSINKELDRYIQWTQVEPLTTQSPLLLNSKEEFLCSMRQQVAKY